MTQTKTTHGGARPGAGRKPKPPPVPVPTHERDMLQLLTDIATGVIDATPNQVRAAIAAVQYTHVKRHDGGKKEDVAEKANKAGTGKYAPMQPPLHLLKNPAH